MAVAAYFQFYFLIWAGVLIILDVQVVQAGTWFSYRLLRNPGLVNSAAGSPEECISKCQLTIGCSAISWQSCVVVNGQSCNANCLLSMCNSLDLNRNTGWNSYVLNATYIESVSFPASHMEWMLTDTCGNNNLGAGLGPAMNLYSATYNPSPSVFAGNAVTFTGSSSSYAKSNSDTNVNNPLQTTSMTIMFWVYFNTATTWSTLFEFTIGTSTRGMLHWVAYSGLYFDWSSNVGTSCGKGTNCVNYSPDLWIPVPNTWYHIAFVYDSSIGRAISYINATSWYTSDTSVFKNNLIWNTVYIGYTPFQTDGPLKGRGFCFKVYKAALDDVQIGAASKSCLVSKARLSS